jgi:pimeloyl-ACP methyl ester carboxylesterase
MTVARDAGVRHEQVRAAGVNLHVARAGDGLPVILLHGFPENWTTWRHQIGPLADAGLSVLAPDLRGYHLSDRPAGRESYHLRHLVDDIAALVRHTGHPRAHIVGHDWGGIIAWTFAGEYPELLDKLVILNAPHMQRFLEKVRRPPQMLRSSYIGFFQLPLLPERALAAHDFMLLRRIFTHTPARKNTYSAADIDEYVASMSRPGALTASLNYYRANMGSGFALARKVRTQAETLVIWGERDPALGTELLERLDEFAPRVRIHRIRDVAHWVQNEAAEEVNRMLLNFLK